MLDKMELLEQARELVNEYKKSNDNYRKSVDNLTKANEVLVAELKMKTVQLEKMFEILKENGLASEEEPSGEVN